jgi:hypothetical protein
MVREFFLQDCDETTTEQARGRLTRQALTRFTQSPRQIAWRQKPATYFVCTEDLATPAQAQRRGVNRTRDSSNSAPGTIRSSQARTHSRRASRRRSTRAELRLFLEGEVLEQSRHPQNALDLPRDDDQM